MKSPMLPIAYCSHAPAQVPSEPVRPAPTNDCQLTLARGQFPLDHPKAVIPILPNEGPPKIPQLGLRESGVARMHLLGKSNSLSHSLLSHALP